MNSDSHVEHVKSLIEEALSKILSDKYDAKITIKFGETKEKEAERDL